MSSDRSDRLGAGVLLLGLVREPGADALDGANACGLLREDEWQAFRDFEDEDLALVHACLGAEFELRARQWSALEFLTFVTNAPAVEVGDRSGAGPSGGEPLVLVSRAEAVAVAETALAWDL